MVNNKAKYRLGKTNYWGEARESCPNLVLRAGDDSLGGLGGGGGARVYNKSINSFVCYQNRTHEGEQAKKTKDFDKFQ